MERVDLILEDQRFQYGLKRIELLEQQRTFCRHNLEHLLDVARIAWIMVLEQNLPLQKDIVYGAALLHDIGRYHQYESQIPHHEASARLALEILPAAGYTMAEVSNIVTAIRHHSTCAPEDTQLLTKVLYQADKLSRNCFRCAARDSCNWEDGKKNKTILY